MNITDENKKTLLFLVEELNKETKLAKAASLMSARKHIERIGILQLRFNAVVAKVFCYGQ